jgi:ribonuclease P protein component
MFPRQARLAREDFPAALKGGRRLNTEHFSIVFSHTTRGYAVVVAKEVARLSVTRHRLKRQINAALRACELPSGLIVFARKGAPTLSPAALRAEIEAGLARLAP